MSRMSFEEMDENTLAGSKAFVMDDSASAFQRMIQYFEQIENPYCFRSGDTPIRIRYVGTQSLSEKLINYFSTLKQRR